MTGVALRRAVKSTLATALHASGVARLVAAATGNDRAPLVLCYHRVISDRRGRNRNAPAMLVRRSTLARQLDWVGRRYRFVDLDELAAALANGARPRRPLAAVTFDDGYADAYENAFPLLARKGIPAAFFVVTDRIGSGAPLDHDRLYFWMRELAEQPGGWSIVAAALRRAGLANGLTEPPSQLERVIEVKEQIVERLPQRRLRDLIRELERGGRLPVELAEDLRPMSWTMVQELHAQGAVIGSHTRSHAVLPNESPEDLFDELAGSKRVLEAALGCEVRHLSYPVGHFTESAVAAAAAAGYRYAYGICAHRSERHPLLTIPRRVVWERSWSSFARRVSPAVAACETAGVFDRRRPCRLDHAAVPAGGSRLAWRAAL